MDVDIGGWRRALTRWMILGARSGQGTWMKRGSFPLL